MQDEVWEGRSRLKLEAEGLMRGVGGEADISKYSRRRIGWRIEWDREREMGKEGKKRKKEMMKRDEEREREKMVEKERSS